MAPERLNRLGVLLKGGSGAPPSAPNGLLLLRNMSIEDLARASNLTRTTIYNYINGEDWPTAPSLRRICEALDIAFEQGLRYCTPVEPGRPALGESRPANFGTARPIARIAQTLPPFAEVLQGLMNERNPPLSIRDLSEESGLFVYEHARKLVRGITLPSDSMVRNMASFFGIEATYLLHVLKKDRFQREYGKDLDLTVGDPELSELTHSWSSLTHNQRESLLSQFRLFLAQNSRREGSESRMAGGPDLEDSK